MSEGHIDFASARLRMQKHEAADTFDMFRISDRIAKQANEAEKQALQKFGFVRVFLPEFGMNEMWSLNRDDGKVILVQEDAVRFAVDSLNRVLEPADYEEGR